jgi:hypothetical protein
MGETTMKNLFKKNSVLILLFSILSITLIGCDNKVMEIQAPAESQGTE